MLNLFLSTVLVVVQYLITLFSFSNVLYLWPNLELARHAAGGKCACETGQTFPPIRAQVFTNKHDDWVEPLEGGIFQHKSH